MLSKKKKVFVLVGMVALLVLTGVLNIVLNQMGKADANPPAGGGVTYANIFDQYRAERTATRDKTMLYLDSIIENEASSASAIEAAEAQKLQLTTNMGLEAEIEGVIRVMGYEDCYVTIGDNVNVIVKSSEELDSTATVQILSIINEAVKVENNHNIIIYPVS